MVIEGDSRPDRVIEKTNSRLPAGKRSPCRDVAVTLRHHAEGMFPTAERTLDPARMFEESLTPRPELENDQDPLQKSPDASQELSKFASALPLRRLPSSTENSMTICRGR
jgi:hypothetical protein